MDLPDHQMSSSFLESTGLEGTLDQKVLDRLKQTGSFLQTEKGLTQAGLWIRMVGDLWKHKRDGQTLKHSDTDPQVCGEEPDGEEPARHPTPRSEEPSRRNTNSLENNNDKKVRRRGGDLHQEETATSRARRRSERSVTSWMSC